MVNTHMRLYDYFTFGDDNGYGQPALSKEPVGKVKMSIEITSHTTQSNIQYQGATYIGLTHDKVSDNFVIQYGTERLKVLYVNPKGRFTQVFMGKMP